MKNVYQKITFNTEKILYYVLISGGVIALSMIAPKLPYELLKAYFKNKKFNQGNFHRDLSRMAYRGEVRIGSNKVVLTKKGKDRVLKYRLEEIEIKKPPVWDKKWRLVVFDIPDYQRKASNTLRYKLQALGFIAYQKSIFIYPYPCQDEIDYIREIFEVGRHVKLITATEIEDMDYFKRKFHLI